MALTDRVHPAAGPSEPKSDEHWRISVNEGLQAVDLVAARVAGAGAAASRAAVALARIHFDGG